MARKNYDLGKVIGLNPNYTLSCFLFSFLPLSYYSFIIHSHSLTSLDIIYPNMNLLYKHKRFNTRKGLGLPLGLGFDKVVKLPSFFSFFFPFSSHFPLFSFLPLFSRSHSCLSVLCVVSG